MSEPSVSALKELVKMTKTTIQATDKLQTVNLPSRSDIQLLLWRNCQFIGALIEDFKTERKKPGKKWTHIIFFMNAQNGLAKTLLESIKDAELESIEKRLERLEVTK